MQIRLTKLQKQILLIAAMLIGTVLVTWLTGLLGRAQFITRTIGSEETWAGIYASLGDVMVYLSVLVLGGPWGAAVSAVGAAIADLILGSASRIIGSLIVKAGMAFFAAAFCRQCTDWKRCFMIAAMTEAIMVIGYFIFDLLIMREFAVAAQAFLVDLAQGVVCGAIGAVLLMKVKPLQPDKLPRVKRAK